VVEGSGFENRRTGNGTRGSNPFSSAVEKPTARGPAALVPVAVRWRGWASAAWFADTALPVLKTAR
jgi:hypothetical protein